MEATLIHLGVELLHGAERVVAGHAKHSLKITRTRFIVDNFVFHEVKLVHKQLHRCWYHLLVELRIKQIGPSLCIKAVVDPIASKSKVFGVIVKKHLHHHRPLIFKI
jgi:hypothetical protein